MNTILRRRRGMMGAKKAEEGIPGTIVTIPQSCTKADEAFSIFNSIASQNTKPGVYVSTKTSWEALADVKYVFLSKSGSSVLAVIRNYGSDGQSVVNNSAYDANLYQRDTFYFVEAIP